MVRRAIPAVLLACGATLSPLAPALAAPHLSARPARPAAARRLSAFDSARRIDVNRVNMFVTNVGSWANDFGGSNSSGFFFPKGTAKTALYESGLWVGALASVDPIPRAPRVAIAEYAQEFGPGMVLPGGTPDDPLRPAYRVFKMARWTGASNDSAHLERTPAELAADPHLDPLAHDSWSDYLRDAAPYGAPTRFYRLARTDTPDPTDSVTVLGPDVEGDQMLWCIYNDADPALHVDDAGSTAPLGLEVKQTTFAFDAAGPLGNTVFMRFKIKNKGNATLDSLYLGPWADPDLGGFTDDLTGCDPARGLGYVYNATNADAVYGSAPPAVGYDLVQSPVDPVTMQPRGLYAFTRYFNGIDPQSPTEVYRYLRGLDRQTGGPIVDPTTGNPTRYMVSGDPIAGTGWIDTNPSDRRMLLSAGPLGLAPGLTAEFAIAIVVGTCDDRLASLDHLVREDDFVQSAFTQNFVAHEPPSPIACATIASCPRPASFWRQECAAGSALTPAQVQDIAARVGALSTYFDWPGGSEHTSFCALEGASTPAPRKLAEREYAAFLACIASAQLSVHESGGAPIALSSALGNPCPGFPAVSLGDLYAVGDTTHRLSGSTGYLDLNPAHPTPLAGVPLGFEQFGGGAGTASELFGGVDPSSDPGAFAPVELRFDHGATQSAYRYLRFEQTDGLAPAVGRTYAYGGFRTVPFTVWDTEHDVQLDVAFVERTVTDANGSILPAGQQVATFDSTWAPDTSSLGGREYLVVCGTTYTASPKPLLAHDGAVSQGGGAGDPPWLFVLWARRLTSSGVIDDGDRFRFDWAVGATPSIEGRMTLLSGRPQGDPATLAAYDSIAAALANVTHGIGIGAVCENTPTTAVMRIDAQAEPDHVALAWFTTEGAGFSAALERRVGAAAWSARATLVADREGTLRYLDRDVMAGTHYDYRLRVATPVGVRTLGETGVTVPAAMELALEGLRPNPAFGVASVAFTLAAAGRARLEVIDVGGRRVTSREVGALGLGRHVVALDGGVVLPPGIYVVRLVTQGHTLVAKGVVLR